MGNEGLKGKKKKSKEDQLFDTAYEFKCTSRQLEKEAAKLQQKEIQEKAKIKTVRIHFGDKILSGNG